MIELQTTIQILYSANTVLLKEKEARKMAAQRGEFFNIFNTCGIAYDEVTLHSNLLAELLNPRGAHGLGGLFLKSLLRDVIADESYFDVEQPRYIRSNILGRLPPILAAE